MPVQTTRTLNPLPFQDLDPKRFEDLVRQLIYDFRNWRRLEATGRAGSDDGFDARGLEITDDEREELADPDPDDDSEGGLGPASRDRLWLVQCKRERAISPKKLLGYLADIELQQHERLHGVIIAAACDFSKRARDEFLNWCREHSIAEAYLWGKGELEDKLLQPKNDNLLFAYFGISLQIRRRSIASQIRALIVMKRKLAKHVTGTSQVLLRDPDAIEYPRLQPGQSKPTQWQVYVPQALTHHGLELLIRRYWAYVDRNTGAWDVMDAIPAGTGHYYWINEDEDLQQLRFRAVDVWGALPKENQTFLEISGAVDVSEILAVDELGDDIFNGPHLYVHFTKERGPFRGFWEILSASSWDSGFAPEPSKRVVKFAPEFRRVE